MKIHGGTATTSRIRTATIAGTVALVTAAGGLLAPASAAPSPTYTEIPLTQSELDASWGTDRADPSGGYESVDGFEGRDDVLEVRIDKDNRSTESAFYYTEGLKRDVDAVDAARIDLFLDPDWFEGEKDVRAGFWGVGNDDAAAVTAYPIVEFTTAGGEGDQVGWRIYDSSVGAWVQHPEIGYTAGEWATLEIVLDRDHDEFDVAVDGSPATSPALGSTNLGDVIVNQYNYGTDADDYEVHWSNFATGSLSHPGDECKDGGWQDFGVEYKNQGQCVAAARSNGHSQHQA